VHCVAGYQKSPERHVLSLSDRQQAHNMANRKKPRAIITVWQLRLLLNVNRQTNSFTHKMITTITYSSVLTLHGRVCSRMSNFLEVLRWLVDAIVNEEAKTEAPQDSFARQDLDRQRQEIAVLKEELLLQVNNVLSTTVSSYALHLLLLLRFFIDFSALAKLGTTASQSCVTAATALIPTVSESQ